MQPIVSTIEIARPPEDVFSYVTDPSRFAEWQKGVIRGGSEGGPPAVGTRCTTTRAIGGSERTATQEITEITPPKSWSVRGIDGPVRADVDVNVEPLDGGARSRVTITLDFHGHGIGKLLVPLFVHRDATKEVPKSCVKLKELLEQPTQHA